LGVFRDAAVEAWRRRDPDFTGIVLAFDLAYENLQPIDSPKFATID
jgi:hypothetical protein